MWGWMFRGGRGRRGNRWRWGRRFGWTALQPTTPLVSSVENTIARKAEEIYKLLPKINCGACGYSSCYECALAIARGEAPADACRIVGKAIKDKVEEILRSY